VSGGSPLQKKCPLGNDTASNQGLPEPTEGNGPGRTAAKKKKETIKKEGPVWWKEYFSRRAKALPPQKGKNGTVEKKGPKKQGRREEESKNSKFTALPKAKQKNPSFVINLRARRLQKKEGGKVPAVVPRKKEKKTRSRHRGLHGDRTVKGHLDREKKAGPFIRQGSLVGGTRLPHLRNGKPVHKKPQDRLKE